MAWIKVIDKTEESTELGKLYSEIEKKRGKLSNILKVHSLKPGTMRAHLDLYLAIMFNKSKIKRELKEMLAVLISQLNGCEYCVNHHSEALRHYWKDDERLARFINDFESIELPEKVKIILQYAKKLTVEPDMMVKKDISVLRKAGYGDEEILEINLIVSYFNFVNRIANGLGVNFSAEEMIGYKY
jgi:uncharacterized peroxidase-related enzyme